MKTINKIGKQTTIIIVAHRFSTGSDEPDELGLSHSICVF